MSAKTISIINFKGGVGKTTLAVNIAACLACDFQKRVLLVDLDAQANASIWLLGAHKWTAVAGRKNMNNTSFGLFTNRISFYPLEEPFDDPSSKGSYLPGFFLVPSSYHLIKLEDMIRKARDRALVDQRYVEASEFRYLTRSVKRVRDRFDFVIYDTPPNLYSVTKNAIYSSDFLVIPCIPDTLSTFGLKLLIYEANRIVRKLKKTPVLLGVILSKKKNVKEHEFGVNGIHASVAHFVNKTDVSIVDEKTAVFDEYPVRERTAHAEAVSDGRPLCLYAPTSEAYRDVQTVTNEMLKAMEART